jgi:hypothetical protein
MVLLLQLQILDWWWLYQIPRSAITTYCQHWSKILGGQKFKDEREVVGGPRWRSWLRHCATSRQVACSIPDGVSGFFHWHNPVGRIMAPGLTQPLTEMSTRNISWGANAAGAYGWQPYHLHVPILWKSGSLNLLEPSGTVQACNWIALPLREMVTIVIR